MLEARLESLADVNGQLFAALAHATLEPDLDAAERYLRVALGRSTVYVVAHEETAVAVLVRGYRAAVARVVE